MQSNYKLSKDWLQVMDLEYFESNAQNNTPKIDTAINFTAQSTDTKQKNMNDNEKSEIHNIYSKLKNINSLKNLKQELENFDGCDLKFGASNLVFGDGNHESDIMLIGEAPGASEDAQGIPFCGDSGKLLDKMIASIGLSRQKNCYITNTVFWRPPANRTPTKEEIGLCRPFVEKHIAIIKPKLIILVGSTAISSLLNNDLKISKIRQEYYNYKNQFLDNHIVSTAIFHPAYLLRQPMQKKTTWYDLLKIQSFIKENNLKI
jgi:uracil-DNA glycosylase